MFGYITRSIWKMLGPFATASHFTLSFTRGRCYRHCRTPPAHRCARRRRRQQRQQNVTETSILCGVENGPLPVTKPVAVDTVSAAEWLAYVVHTAALDVYTHAMLETVHYDVASRCDAMPAWLGWPSHDVSAGGRLIEQPHADPAPPALLG